LRNSRRSLLKVAVWIKELRAPFFTATIVPVLLGTIIAWYEYGFFSATIFVLTLTAALCLDGGTNMINDYFDYRSGCDLHPQYKEFSAPFFGGSRLLPEGILKPRDVFIAAVISFALGGTIGVVLAFNVGWVVLLLGGIGVISGYLYTKLSSRGLGEFFVFLNAGPLVVIGSYYVQVQNLSVEPIVASLPIGFLIASVLWINEIPDCAADKAAGKNTQVVRLGKKKAADVYAILMIMPYVLIIFGVVSRLLPTFSSIALATLPLALQSIIVVRGHYEETSKLVSASVGTILTHLFTGILLMFGYILTNFPKF
jgi:1,4-dihydroxy-2-naphthoate octaprenyltransferase